jgi:phosphatidylethanolamine/phosphatidyl-N-methylethanolamine N-methyltransferase
MISSHGAPASPALHRNRGKGGSNRSRWNQLRYSMLAPIYDFGAEFAAERRTAFARLALAPGENVLVVGVGTGADLPHIRKSVRGVAVDLAPAMLERARLRRHQGFELRVMNGEQLEFPERAFDAVVLHQVLEVVRDPARCLAEAARVLKPGGRISVFDKFLPRGFHPPLWHRVAKGAVDVLFTTANRSFEEILARSAASLVVESDEPCSAFGPFRILLLRKPA